MNYNGIFFKHYETLTALLMIYKYMHCTCRRLFTLANCSLRQQKISKVENSVLRRISFPTLFCL